MVRIDSAQTNRLLKHLQVGVMFQAIIENHGIPCFLETYTDSDGGTLVCYADVFPPNLISLLEAMGVEYRTIDFYDDEVRTINTYEVTIKNFPIAIVAQHQKHAKHIGAQHYEQQQKAA